MNILGTRRTKTFITSFVTALVLVVGISLSLVHAQTSNTKSTNERAVTVAVLDTAAGSGTTAFSTLLSGYAWSADIGWIRMSNCASATDCTGQNYGVSIAPTGSVRAMTGYGWSPNIGWVSFNLSATTGCPGGGTCQARIEWVDGESKIYGWARACAVFKNPNCSAADGLKDDAERGGWDGFIALRSIGGAQFGVSLDTTTGKFGGQAWGSDIVGWVDFSKVALIEAECQPGDPCYCVANPTDVTNCPQCEEGSPCWCADPEHASDPRCAVCEEGQPCWCQDPAHANTRACEECKTVGTPCWCANPLNQTDPAYPKACVGTGEDMCTNVEGVQNTLPTGSHQSGTRCVCDAGKVLKKVNGLYQCVKPSYIEL